MLIVDNNKDNDMNSVGYQSQEIEKKQEEFIIMDKEKLKKHLELMKVRIYLEETNLLSMPETDYFKPENIHMMARFLIMKSETQKALNLCSKFKSAFEDTIGYYIKRFFENGPSIKEVNEEYEKKFYDFLEKVLKLVEKKEKQTYLKIIAQDILYYSAEILSEPTELPYFIISTFMEENPNDLIRIYLDFGLLEVAYIMR